MRVCRTHGGAAPQVREAARLRLALLADPAVRRLEKIITHGEDAQALAAIVTVQTQVNLAQPRFAEMSDADLEAYDRLLTELKALLPKDEPKRIGGMTR